MFRNCELRGNGARFFFEGSFMVCGLWSVVGGLWWQLISGVIGFFCFLMLEVSLDVFDFDFVFNFDFN